MVSRLAAAHDIMTHSYHHSLKKPAEIHTPGPQIDYDGHFRAFRRAPRSETTRTPRLRGSYAASSCSLRSTSIGISCAKYGCSYIARTSEQAVQWLVLSCVPHCFVPIHSRVGMGSACKLEGRRLVDDISAVCQTIGEQLTSSLSNGTASFDPHFARSSLSSRDALSH